MGLLFRRFGGGFFILLDSGLNSLGIRAYDLTKLLAVLEESKSGHSADAEFLGDVGNLIDVELVKLDIGVLLRVPVVILDLRQLQTSMIIGTYLTMVGAIILQGPHHVAKQSRTIKVSLMSIASL